MTVMESWKKKWPTVRNNNPAERKRKTNGRLLYSFVLLSILYVISRYTGHRRDSLYFSNENFGTFSRLFLSFFSACRSWPSSVWWKTSSATQRRKVLAVANKTGDDLSCSQHATRNLIERWRPYQKEGQWPNAKASRMFISSVVVARAEWTVLMSLRASACPIWTWNELKMKFESNRRRQTNAAGRLITSNTVIDFSTPSNAIWVWNRPELVAEVIAKVETNGILLLRMGQISRRLFGAQGKSTWLVAEFSVPTRPEDRLWFSLLRQTLWPYSDKDINLK